MTYMVGLTNLLLMVENKELKGMPVKYPEFADRVQAAMKRHGLTVTDIKDELKISYEMARRYTLGQAMPRTGKMAQLAKVLGADPADLQFGGEKSTIDAKPVKTIDEWPFTVKKSRYDQMPREEKDRLDGLVEHTITAWEHAQHRKSKKTA